jgi:hypothetical protein
VTSPVARPPAFLRSSEAATTGVVVTDIVNARVSEKIEIRRPSVVKKARPMQRSYRTAKVPNIQQFTHWDLRAGEWKRGRLPVGERHIFTSLRERNGSASSIRARGCSLKLVHA